MTKFQKSLHHLFPLTKPRKLSIFLENQRLHQHLSIIIMLCGVVHLSISIGQSSKNSDGCSLSTGCALPKWLTPWIIWANLSRNNPWHQSLSCANMRRDIINFFFNSQVNEWLWLLFWTAGEFPQKVFLLRRNWWTFPFLTTSPISRFCRQLMKLVVLCPHNYLSFQRHEGIMCVLQIFFRKHGLWQVDKKDGHEASISSFFVICILVVHV